MKYSLFSDLFNWLPKSTTKAGNGLTVGDYPFFTSSARQTKWIDKPLFSTKALILGTGGSASIHYADGKFGVSTDCVVAQKKENFDFNIKYVYYYLKANIFLLEKGFKGAGLKHVAKSYIERLEIPLPNIIEQDKIVATLDKVQSLINIRELAIKQLDELILSVYLSMFGQRNPDFDQWTEVEIGSYKNNSKRSIRTGPFGSSLKHEMFKEDGDVAVLGIDNAVENIFRYGKNRFITLQEYDKFKAYTVYSRDVIITLMGTVGRSAVIPENIGLVINTKHIAAITLDENKCNPYYLSFSIHSNPYVQDQLRTRSRGAVMDGLNLSILKQLKIKDAPILLQNEFEKKYLKIQNSKNLLLESKQLLDTLLASLFQRLFLFKDSVDINIELDALINSIDLEKSDDFNDITIIKRDKVYINSLLDRINEQQFDDIDQYQKAKYVLFRLMNDGIAGQEYDIKSKNITLS